MTPSPSVPVVGDLVWHVHHETLVEPLTEPFENRVAYIRSRKPREEISVRLRLMKPVRGNLSFLKEAYNERDKVDAERVEASAELDKARAEWVKARAEWGRASAELDKARAEWVKARAEWVKARAEWGRACAEWGRASAEWDKASAELYKADAERSKASADPRVLELHAKECPDCPWDGKTIFPGAK